MHWTRSQADRAGHESPGEESGQPHQTVGVNWRFPVWLRHRQRHNRCNLYCQATVREVSNCQQETLHGFCKRRLIKCLRRSSGGHWQNLLWRSRLCDWCRGCMPMWWTMSVLVKGTVKSLKWSSVFTKTRYAARWSSSLRLNPCHASSALESPGRTSMPMTLLSSLNHSRDMSGGSWLGKEAKKEKGLRVNAEKTTIMVYGTGLDLLQCSGEFPCAVYCTGVGSNSIFCNGCKHWVRKKCSGLKRLTKDPDYRCTRCQGTAHPLDGRPQREVQVVPDKLEVSDSLCWGLMILQPLWVMTSWK